MLTLTPEDNNSLRRTPESAPTAPLKSQDALIYTLGLYAFVFMNHNLLAGGVGSVTNKWNRCCSRRDNYNLSLFALHHMWNNSLRAALKKRYLEAETGNLDSVERAEIV